MVSSLTDAGVRGYFITTMLAQYVSKGTELVVTVTNDVEKDVALLHVNVIRTDGKMILLSSELTIDESNWPKPSKELIGQLMMVG